MPLCRAVSKTIPPQNRFSLWRPYWWDSPATDPFSRLERNFREMERDFERMWASPRFGVFDLTPRRAAADLERFHLQQPIVEEEGKKKFKLVFDASHFKPNDINVKTNGRRLSISARHETKEKGREEKYEYKREYELPEGVKAEEVTCKYTNDGQLVVEAPYTPPAVESKEQEISVKHE